MTPAKQAAPDVAGLVERLKASRPDHQDWPFGLLNAAAEALLSLEAARVEAEKEAALADVDRSAARAGQAIAVRRAEAAEARATAAEGDVERLIYEAQALAAALKVAREGLEEIASSSCVQGAREMEGTARDTLARLSAAPAEGVGSDDWRPIETAPRDGTWFEARTAHGSIRTVHFHHRSDRMPINHVDGCWYTEPTHWRPARPDPQPAPAEGEVR